MLLALPRATGPGPAAGPHPLLVFLHGGPVGALACGEHPDPSAAAGRLVYQAVTAWFERHQITDP